MHNSITAFISPLNSFACGFQCVRPREIVVSHPICIASSIFIFFFKLLLEHKKCCFFPLVPLHSMVFGSGSVRRHNDAADAVQMNVNVASMDGDREKKTARTHTMAVMQRPLTLPIHSSMKPNDITVHNSRDSDITVTIFVCIM